LKKVMLLAAVVAMVLAAAVPAFAQKTGQVNDADVACIQTAVQGDVEQVAGSQYGDASNINVQTIAQECNITVAQANSVINVVKGDNNGKKIIVDGKKVVVDHGKKVVVDHGKKVVVHKASASATASASAAPKVQYKVEKQAAPVVQYQYKASATASASAPAAVEYEYSASASSASAAEAELPETGGSSLIALGAGVLLVAGGLLARRIVR
jgi:LPXTG-motif cell wall-anchored protein